MKNKLQISIILEYFWLIIFILAGMKGLVDTVKSGISTSYVFFIMSFLALLLYLARRSLRKKENRKDLS